MKQRGAILSLPTKSTAGKAAHVKRNAENNMGGNESRPILITT